MFSARHLAHFSPSPVRREPTRADDDDHPSYVTRTRGCSVATDSRTPSVAMSVMTIQRQWQRAVGGSNHARRLPRLGVRHGHRHGHEPHEFTSSSPLGCSGDVIAIRMPDDPPSPPRRSVCSLARSVHHLFAAQLTTSDIDLPVPSHASGRRRPSPSALTSSALPSPDSHSSHL